MSSQVLRFPSSHSVGQIFSRPANQPWIDWEHLGEAQSDVEVSRNKVVRIKIERDVDNALRHIVQSSAARIHTLDLTAAGAADSDITQVASLSGLRVLNLDRNPQITDKCMADLSKLWGLQELTLGFATITDRGLTCISTAKRLKTLSLAYTGITSDSAYTIKSLSNLQWLWLTACPIDDAAIGQISTLHRLAWLRLTNTLVTDAAVGPLSEMKSLTWLWVEQTGLTRQGVEKLRALLPQCNICDHTEVGGEKRIKDEVL